MFQFIGSDGIVEPVSARIYIPGKSLDYNMLHKERKHQSTVEKTRVKNYTRNESNVFDIINAINSTKSPSKLCTSSTRLEVKSQSRAQLNINSFKIEEDIKKVQKSLDHLIESSKRNSCDSPAMKNIQRQIACKQSDLESLKKRLSEFDKERSMRKEKSKFTIF